MKILQLVGANEVLGLLRRRLGGAVVGRHQFGTDLGGQDSPQHRAAAAPTWPLSATQRTRCLISVFGTLALTL